MKQLSHKIITTEKKQEAISMFRKKQADVVLEDERSLEDVQEVEEMMDVHNHYIMRESGGAVSEIRIIDPIERPRDY